MLLLETACEEKVVENELRNYGMTGCKSDQWLK